LIPFAPKKRKNWDFKLTDMTPMSKCQRLRSQRNVTYPVKNCNNPVPGGPINFILGTDITTTPQQVGHKTVAMATLVA